MAEEPKSRLDEFVCKLHNDGRIGFMDGVMLSCAVQALAELDPESESYKQSGSKFVEIAKSWVKDKE